MQHIHIYPGPAKPHLAQAHAAGIYLQDGSGVDGADTCRSPEENASSRFRDALEQSLPEALQFHVPDALEAHLPDALENHIGDAIDAHLGDAIDSAIESAVKDTVPNAVEEAIQDSTAGLVEDICEEVRNVVKPILCHLRRTTNQARNRKRQTRGVSDLMPMPDQDGHTRPRNNRDVTREVRTVSEVNALTESQARAWLKFLDEPLPTLSGTSAAKLATLRQAVLDGFRGD